MDVSPGSVFERQRVEICMVRFTGTHVFIVPMDGMDPCPFNLIFLF
jgi:hypothetical protein